MGESGVAQFIAAALPPFDVYSIVMSDNRKRLGDFGEQIAKDRLEKHGYEIVQCNYRCSIGEIDIIARDRDCLVFVEVRTKRDRQFGTPEESITLAKQARLIELAETYLQEHQISSEHWRIDVVAVEVSNNEKISRVEIIENAVN